MHPDYRKCYITHMISLFNIGKLTLCSADWFARNGLAVICAAGRVVDIVEDEQVALAQWYQ